MLLAVWASAAGARTPPPSVRIQVYSPDSVALSARYYPARDGVAPAVLCLHGQGSSGNGFASLAAALQQAGMPVLVPDLRGEGRSRTTAKGAPVPAAQTWGARERQILAADLRPVLKFALNQPGITGRPWALVAESEAATLAMELAAASQDFKRLVLLSPLTDPDMAPAALPEGAALLLVACEQDSTALLSLRALYGALPAASRRMDLLPCRSRGARMLRWQPDLADRLVDWIRR